MEEDADIQLSSLMTDGGITSNHFVMQLLADLLGKEVVSISFPDVSALGAAYLAGLKAGVYENIEHLKTLNSNRSIVIPGTNAEKVNDDYEGWKKAVSVLA